MVCFLKDRDHVFFYFFSIFNKQRENVFQWKENKLQSQANLNLNHSSPQTSCASLGKPFKFFKLQFPHLQNGDNNCFSE